ncbi:DNA primase [Lachnospiraceae bacterium MD329]|nr:DNA primase [Lachnospiraceae bacterium MD329]
MSIFKTIKEQLNLIDTAKHYGVSIRRNGFANCIFHNDKHPSMKLYKDHYHCFACGAHGDVISFSAQLFGLPPYEAAKLLATDFGIADIKAISRKQQYLTENTARSILTEYVFSLKSNRDKYRPCSPDEELHPLYIESIKLLPLYEYYLDILTSGSKEERKLFINTERRLFNELQAKLRQR